MEGPSIVLLTEELKPFLRKKPVKVSGTVDVDYSALSKSTFKSAESWGKHLILQFGTQRLRIHFLMFGSYRINDQRDRDPKFRLEFEKGYINFYSCSVKSLPSADYEKYDWTIDLMSETWDEKKVVKLLRAKKHEQICDLLMDQTIFPGLGNIIKNEVMYLQELHPETPLDSLKASEQLALVRRARSYSLQFYEWKKINQLKRNWKVFRKRKCPDCQGALSKSKTGKLERVSFWCPVCQTK